MKLVSFFDLAPVSPLLNVAGSSPTTADMRGSSVVGAQREWGALEFDPSLSFYFGVSAKVVTPFDVSSACQLVNLAGISPPTTDIRGALVVGSQREWGSLEYNPALYPLFHYGFIIGLGSLTIAGYDILWSQNSNIVLGLGSLVITGYDITFSQVSGAHVQLLSGSLVITGYPVGFNPVYIIPVVPRYILGVNCDLLLMHPEVNNGQFVGFLLYNLSPGQQFAASAYGPAVRIHYEVYSDELGIPKSVGHLWFTVVLGDYLLNPDGSAHEDNLATMRGWLLQFVSKRDSNLLLVHSAGSISNLSAEEHIMMETVYDGFITAQFHLSARETVFTPVDPEVFAVSYWQADDYEGELTWDTSYWR